MKRLKQLSPLEISRLAPFLLGLMAMLALFFLPPDANTRGTVLLLAGVTMLFALVIHLPILKGRVTIAATRWGAFANTLMITFAFALLGNKVPLVAAIYLVSIAAIGIRRGLKYALLTAFLSSIGYLSALTLVQGIRLEDTDSAVLIGLFFLIAFLVGLLSEAAQKQARDSENIVTRSREAIMIFDAHGNFEYLNPAAIAIGGYTEAELKGHSFFEVIDPADHANARAVWDALAAQAPTNQVFQVRLRRKDGGTRVLAATLTMHDPDTPRYLAIARDITDQEIERAVHERRLRELEAERTVVAAVSQTVDLPRVLDLALEQALRALQVDVGAIYLADEAQTELTLAVWRHPAPEYATRWKRHLFGEGITGHAATLREPILVSNLDLDPRVSMENREYPRLLSQVSVPLIVQDRVVGVLNVNGYEPQHFTEDDVALLRAIGASVAVAIDHARLYETLEHRVVERSAELAALSRIAVAINQSLDLNSVLDTALGEVTRTLQVRGGWLYLLDSTGSELVLRAERGGTSAVIDHYKTIQVGQGPIGRMIETRQPFAANLDDIAASGREQLQAAQYRSMCGVPLLIEERIVGVIGLASDQRDRFGEAEVNWLSAVGNTIGVALKNTQLFEETSQRADQFRALYETAHDLARLQDLPALLQTIVTRAVGLLNTSGGAMYLYDPARGDLRIEVTTHPSTPVGTRLTMGEGMAGRVAQTLQPLIVNDYRTWPHRSQKYEGSPLTAVIEVPMLYGGELIGVLVVEEVGETKHQFGEDDARLLSLFAGQAASAVHNAQLLVETKQHGERLALLNRIARALSATLKLDDLLEIVYREISTVMDTDAFFLALYDASTNELDFRIRVDNGVRETVQRQLQSPGLTNAVITNKKPILIRDFDHEKDQLPQARVWGTMRAPQSWLGVPMLLGDKLLGVISVQAYRTNAYTFAEQELLSTIADTVAVAVENARLFEETAQRAEQLGTLREIDRTLSSMLDLEPMLQATLSRLEEIVPYDSAAVLLRDGEILRATAARGREENALKQFALDISTNAIFAEMDRQRVPIIIDDLTKSSTWAVVPGLEFARAWLGAPLVARGELIGQIGIFSGTPGKFTREHAELVLSFANHAAISIANAQLRAALNEQARRDSLTQVLNHGAFIENLRATAARGESVAMIMFDLDNFKRYNDTYGHVVGDRVLQATALAIRAHVKNTDFIGRWGGEEFAIALCGAKLDGALHVAERIRVTLAETLIKDRHAHLIPAPTASQGIASLSETARDVDELIEQADRALYRAKSRGRDQTALAER
ncbi:MAG TPA: GAF domain-containing protein [Anaerolineae bacterium]